MLINHVMKMSNLKCKWQTRSCMMIPHQQNETDWWTKIMMVDDSCPVGVSVDLCPAGAP